MDIISTRTLLLLIYITFGRNVHAQTDEETSLEESLGEGNQRYAHLRVIDNTSLDNALTRVFYYICEAY